MTAGDAGNATAVYSQANIKGIDTSGWSPPVGDVAKEVSEFAINVKQGLQ